MNTNNDSIWISDNAFKIAEEIVNNNYDFFLDHNGLMKVIDHYGNVVIEYAPPLSVKIKDRVKILDK